MKILAVNNFNYYRGGSESVYFNTVRILREHGHQVRCFSQIHKENIPCDDDRFFFNAGSNKLSRTLKYFYNPDVERKLEILLSEFKPDVAHVHLMWGCTAPALLKVLRKHGIPVVHTAHDYRMVCPGYLFRDGKGTVCEDCSSGHYLHCIRRKCCKGSLTGSILMTLEMYIRQRFYNPLNNISGFLFVSKFSENIHIAHEPAFASAVRTVLYNCTERRQPVNPMQRQGYFLYYGRLSAEKGVDTLIKAFSKLPELNLKIAGTGPVEDSLRQTASKNVEFLGYHTGKELFDIVSAARFVVVPSNWYENNPMTVIESCSLGVPVIGRKMGGIPEIIEQGTTGFLYEADSPDELASVIRKASSLSDAEYSRMCAEAGSFYDRNFSEDSYYGKLIDFYDKIIYSQK